MCLWVCVRALTCVYAAFTHVNTDVCCMRTIHVRPYIHVAYDAYVLGPCRAERAGSRGPQEGATGALRAEQGAPGTLSQVNDPESSE